MPNFDTLPTSGLKSPSRINKDGQHLIDNIDVFLKNINIILIQLMRLILMIIWEMDHTIKN